jgi:acyl-CoA synthetase (AMP-forming)/AMP-acid ligase II
LPHTHIAIVQEIDGRWLPCPPHERGEICVRNPGVAPEGPYAEAARNHGLMVAGGYLRTGDLGRLDGDGYLWITGRVKDIIIRGGHNIDPGMIEEALMSHPAVALAAAVAQPDPVAGELPCAFVELVAGAEASGESILASIAPLITERAAIPKHLEILPSLPRTGVGKIFKPDLRRLAIARVLRDHLATAGCDAEVVAVQEDRSLGLTVILRAKDEASRAQAAREMDRFSLPWAWDGTP